MAELEAGRRRGRSTFPLRLVRDRLERHIELWAGTWAKQAVALMAQFEDVSSHLCVATARLQETEDQITLAHVREASLEILGEKERYMITIAALYEGLERDYVINGRKTLRNIKESEEPPGGGLRPVPGARRYIGPSGHLHRRAAKRGRQKRDDQ